MRIIASALLLAGLMASSAAGAETRIEWWAFTTEQGTMVMASAGGIARAYRIADDGSATKLREWSDLHHWWYSLDQRYVFISAGSHTEMLRPTDWERPILTEQSGLPGNMSNVARLYAMASAGAPAWRSFAVYGLAAPDAAKPVWRLIAATDGDNFQPVSVPGGDAMTGSLLRVGNAGFAAWAGDAWRVFCWTNGHWVDADLPGVHPPFRSINVREELLLAVSNEERSALLGFSANWTWFLLDADGSWRPLQEMIPQLPRYVSAINLHGSPDALDIVGFDETPVQESHARQIFVVRTPQGWAEPDTLLNLGKGTVSDAASLLGGRVLGVRLLPTAQDDVGDGWRWFVRDGHGAWTSLQDTLRRNGLAVPGAIWDVRAIGTHGGIGIQWKISSGDAVSFAWDWFASTGDEGWTSLGKALPTGGAEITDLDMDDRGEAAVATMGEKQDRRNVFIRRSDGSWETWDRHVRHAPLELKIVEASWPGHALRLEGADGSDMMLVYSGQDHRWHFSPRSVLADFQ